MTNAYIRVETAATLQPGDILHIYEHDGRTMFSVIPRAALLAGLSVKPSTAPVVEKPPAPAQLQLPTTNAMHRPLRLRGARQHELKERLTEAVVLMPGRTATELTELLSVHGYRRTQVQGAAFRLCVAGVLRFENAAQGAIYFPANK